MERREQVFICSTYLDLVEERHEVVQILLEADCIPAGMELFAASDDDRWTLIKRVIDDCDYFIVIGGRYGSMDPDQQVSYTEMEYDYTERAHQSPISTDLLAQGFDTVDRVCGNNDDPSRASKVRERKW